MQKFLALLRVRNKEFLRDRSTLAWNFAFPFLVIFGLATIFSGNGRDLYKVGVVGPGPSGNAAAREFLKTDFVDFISVTDLAGALEKVRRHQYDMVLDVQGSPRYWINRSNPKGYFLERVLWGSGAKPKFEKQVLEGREIRYVDWLLPGVLAMNMMFSCLFGVGYVIVRYRKAGILRRLKAAPITALQFLSAQVVSRLMLVMFVTAVLYFGSDLILDFFLLGSLFSLFFIFTLGAVCLISLGLLVAARTSSQELAGGLLNLLTWPMMFLSGVWFSLEGSDPWLIWLARIFPLTHLIDAARSIMVDGAGLADLWPQIAILSLMTVVFMAIGSALFRWE